MALNPTGPINLRGNFDLERVGLPGEPLRSRWDMRLTLQQTGLQCGGLLLENLHGNVFAVGRLRRTAAPFARRVGHRFGQPTRIASGSTYGDRSGSTTAGYCSASGWISRRTAPRLSEDTGPAQPPRPVTASLFGGTFGVDGWVVLAAEPYYVVNATLTDADLARCAQQLAAGRHNLRGRILATVDLKGSGFTRNTLSGKGGIRLSNADVYQLPVMLSLLKIFSIRPPDQNAFSGRNINYRIEGEHIYFDRIDFRRRRDQPARQGRNGFPSQIGLDVFCQGGAGRTRHALWSSRYSAGRVEQLYADPRRRPLARARRPAKRPCPPSTRPCNNCATNCKNHEHWSPWHRRERGRISAGPKEGGGGGTHAGRGRRGAASGVL